MVTETYIDGNSELHGSFNYAFIRTSNTLCNGVIARYEKTESSGNLFLDEEISDALPYELRKQIKHNLESGEKISINTHNDADGYIAKELMLYLIDCIEKEYQLEAWKKQVIVRYLDHDCFNLADELKNNSVEDLNIWLDFGHSYLNELVNSDTYDFIIDHHDLSKHNEEHFAFNKNTWVYCENGTNTASDLVSRMLYELYYDKYNHYEEEIKLLKAVAAISDRQDTADVDYMDKRHYLLESGEMVKFTREDLRSLSLLATEVALRPESQKNLECAVICAFRKDLDSMREYTHNLESEYVNLSAKVEKSLKNEELIVVDVTGSGRHTGILSSYIWDKINEKVKTSLVARKENGKVIISGRGAVPEEFESSAKGRKGAYKVIISDSELKFFIKEREIEPLKA